MTEKEIRETINKLSKQLTSHCENCPSASHAEFLQEIINELQLQLETARGASSN